MAPRLVWGVMLYGVLLLMACRHSVVADPRAEAAAATERGYALLGKRDPDAALVAFTEAIRLDPKAAIAFEGRGTSYLWKRDFDKAIADYTEAIRLNPKIASAYGARGTAYNNNRELDKAINDYTELLRLQPENTHGHLVRGIAYAHRGDFDKAISDYTEAIRLIRRSRPHMETAAPPTIANASGIRLSLTTRKCSDSTRKTLVGILTGATPT